LEKNNMGTKFQLFGIPSILGAIIFGFLYYSTGNPLYVLQAFNLSLIEVSMSFDNACVNEQKLKHMTPFWQQIFFWLGIPIAVAGMRFYVPLQIVSLIEGSSLHSAYNMAINAPEQFSVSLSKAHASIAAFGGAFLLLTALDFFGGDEKEHDWLPGENILKAINPFRSIVAVALTAVAWYFTNQRAVFTAGCAGILVFALMGFIKAGMEKIDSKLADSTIMALRLLQGGLGGFLYLEVLDASFSLDGVVAAFAISKNIWVVAAGLGVGAIFVRQLTLWMVKTGASATFKYLPNGAFASIFVLSITMFISIFHEVPDFIVSAMSVGFIVVALISSKLSRDSVTVKAGGVSA
jgi:hypothetical protein